MPHIQQHLQLGDFLSSLGVHAACGIRPCRLYESHCAVVHVTMSSGVSHFPGPGKTLADWPQDVRAKLQLTRAFIIMR